MTPFDSPALLRAADEVREQHGFRTIRELMDLCRNGNVIFDTLSVMISSRVRIIGAGNRFYASVLIECNAPGDLVIGDNNVFFSGCHLLADPGKIRIGDANQFGEGGCFIKANRADALIDIGSNGRYVAGAWLLGRSMLGSGSQVIGQVHVEDCHLGAGQSYACDDPDLRGAVLKGFGDARGLRVRAGHVIRAENGRFEQGNEQLQASFHPRKRDDK
jgi:hypothetical protein